MKSRRYAEPLRLSREQALAQLKNADPYDRMDAILSLTLYEPDWRLGQSISLKMLDDPNIDVVATAILGLSHVARLHRHLDLDQVLPRLEPLKSNPTLNGRIIDVLNDFDTYLKTEHN